MYNSIYLSNFAVVDVFLLLFFIFFSKINFLTRQISEEVLNVPKSTPLIHEPALRMVENQIVYPHAQDGHFSVIKAALQNRKNLLIRRAPKSEAPQIHEYYVEPISYGTKKLCCYDLRTNRSKLIVKLTSIISVQLC